MSSTRTIPASELYWGLIDASSFPPIPFGVLRPAAVRRRLENQLDAVLPVPVEDLHVVCWTVGEKRHLMCAIERHQIAALCEGASSLQPDSVPEWVIGDTAVSVQTSDLELLTGPYTPHARIERANRMARLAAACLLLLAVVFSVGNLRRAAAFRAASVELRARQAAIYQDALGPQTGRMPQAIRLTAELRRLSQTRGQEAGELKQPDAPGDLQSVLGVWPADAELRIERISVDGDRIDISGEAANAEDIRKLIASLNELEGWEIPVQSIDRSRIGQAARARLGLQRRERDGGNS